MSTLALIDVAAGTAVVIAVVVSLVAILLLFERKFIPRGPFRISIHEESLPSFTAENSDTLLSLLRDHDILLSSACGGGGTCGLCKVQVLEGGGHALPSERAALKRTEVATGWRLSCQLKVREDLKIALPKSVAGAKILDCQVVSVRDVATFIRELTFATCGNESLEFFAGSFIQIHVPAYQALRFGDFEIAEKYRIPWQQLGFLDLVARNEKPTSRAYSLANPPSEVEHLVLNVRIATPPRSPPKLLPGIASSYLYSLRAGDQVTVSGPFGDFQINDSEREMLYVGGGAGMAPLRSQILHLFNTLHTKRKVSYFYGARSSCDIFYNEEFEALAAAHDNFSFHLALSEPQPEDDWQGDTGFIHQVVQKRYLADHPNPGEIEVYICGPPLMLSATLELAAEFGIDKHQIRYDDFGS